MGNSIANISALQVVTSELTLAGAWLVEKGYRSSSRGRGFQTRLAGRARAVI
eukprot:COSAG02_NODE_1063_length_14846_cov_134.162745_12_plen_52_part_00